MSAMVNLPTTKTDGHTTLQVDQAVSGHLGKHRGRVTIVPLSCSEAGVSWPDLLLIYGPGRRLLDTVRLREVIGGQAHAEVGHIRLSRSAYVRLSTSTQDGYLQTAYRAHVWWAGGGAHIRLGPPQTIDGAPPGTDPLTMPAIRGPHQSDNLKPAPPGLRRFLQRQRDIHRTYVKLERYRHKAGGVALVDWDPGDEEGKVAGKVDGRWQWLATYWNRGQERPTCSDITGSTLVNAWKGLGLTCNDHGTVVTLGHWPSSGR